MRCSVAAVYVFYQAKNKNMRVGVDEAILVLLTARKIGTFERNRNEHCSKLFWTQNTTPAKSDHADSDYKALVAS